MATATQGSSPRVRGAGDGELATEAVAGIIPARAGSSEDPIPFSHWARDHPRACGEQCKAFPNGIPDKGSSPRVRGAVHVQLATALNKGIIPARAGSRKLELPPQSLVRDHPRACGEQREATKLLMDNTGSSPRVRGAG